jgi:hypothetical protein
MVRWRGGMVRWRGWMDEWMGRRVDEKEMLYYTSNPS